MIRTRYTNNGKAAEKIILDASWQGIQRAVVFFWQQLQQALNVPNPRPYKNSSKPGEPPRKRTGFGAKHVIYELDPRKQAARVGVLSNAKYMATLELYLYRPWLLATLKKVLPRLRQMVRVKAG